MVDGFPSREEARDYLYSSTRGHVDDDEEDDDWFFEGIVEMIDRVVEL